MPTTTAADDATPLELGMPFSMTTSGYVTGVRFYKGAGNTGTHTGSLWSTGGQRLATGTFTGETASGWQTLIFATPVAITAGTTYVASYYAPVGRYAADAGYFATSGVTNEPLAVAPDGAGSPAGVFNAGGSAFPTASYGSTNYWVDPIVTTVEPTDTLPPTAGPSAPPAGASSVARTGPVSVALSESVQPTSVAMQLTDPAGSTLAGTVGYDDTTRTATFTPTEQLAAGTAYTATLLSARDRAGNALTAPVSWTFTTMKAPAVAGACPCSVWDDTAVPAVTSADDRAAVELGMRFTVESDGVVAGVRFYKGAGNTGTHTGTLWSATGTELATATATAESTTGWQTITFGSPVRVTAGTTYVVSYHTDAGGYSVTAGGLTAPVVSGPITVQGSGVYAYGPRSFPARDGGGSNYWVDVTFTSDADTTAPVVTSATPGPGATSVRVGRTLSVTLSEPVSGARLTLSQGGTPVDGAVTSSTSGRSVILTPSSALTAATSYTATLSGARDAAGNTLAAPYTWSFTTSGPTVCPCTLLSDETPATAAVDESAGVELGVRLRTDIAGYISGVRFYKGAGNTGTHTGSLWTDGGALLATGTFTNETATGWQQLSFDRPVAVTAATTYVVSYYAPNGHYSASPGAFTSALDNAPLRAVADVADDHNGVFSYGAASSFPVSSYGSTSYSVDAVFQTTAVTDTVAPTLTGTYPATGAASVTVTDPVEFTFDEPVQAASATITVSTGTGTAVTGATSLVGTATLRFQPDAALPAGAQVTATVSGVRDTAGNQLATTGSTSFTTAATATAACPCSLFLPSAVPAIASATDGSAVELGMRFSSDTSGYVTGVRFYKGAANTGTHTGSLWSADGTRLATATFGAETSSGWQTVQFASPVPVTAGTTYVVSYHTTVGRYSYDRDAFAAGSLTRGPLTAPQATSSVPNGVYSYGSASTFPVSGGATNYWVDPVFSLVGDTTAPTVTGTTPAAGATGVAGTVAPSATFSEPVDPSSVVLTLTGPGGPVAGAVTLSGAVATFTPAAALGSVAGHTATATARDVAGNAMATPVSWTFTTSDTAPPVVTAVAATATATSATITWTTDEPASSTVQSGTSPTVLGSTTTGPGGVLAHSVTVTGLVPGTAYSYRVVSADAAGNSSTSPAVGAPAATVSTRTDLALGATATASSSDEVAPRGRAKAVDGVFTSTSTSAGWSSTSSLTTNHTEWFQVDLGAARSVDEVVLWPRTDGTNAGYGYPVDSTVATSVDGTTWATVSTVTGAALPTTAQRATFASRTARYVKVTGTSLRANPADSGSYRMQFAEVGVFGNGATPDTTAPTVTVVSPRAASTGAPLTVAPTATFSEPVAPATLTMTMTGPSGTAVAGTATVDAAGTAATFTPSSALVTGTSYTVTVRTVQDRAGNALAAAYTWSFSTPVDLALSRTVTASSSSEVAPWGRARAVDGVLTSTSSSAGWRSSNSLTTNHTEWFQVDLGAARSVNEVTVWPRTDGANAGYGYPVDFTIATSVDGTTWTTVASVTGAPIPTGVQRTTFANRTARYVKVTGTSLRANPSDGGSYRMAFAELAVYGDGSTPDTTAPTVTAVSPTAGATGVATSVTPVVTFSEPVTAATVTLTGPAGAVTGSVALGADKRTATFTPAAALAGSTTYTLAVPAATDLAGNALAAASSGTFSTVTPPCPCSLFGSADVPPTAAVTATTATERGMKFSSLTGGWVTAVRFHKGTGATGVHTGSVWTTGGQRLATVRFSDETATGWQTATLAQPVQVTAGTTYVVSYTAPAGRWSETPSYFATARSSGNLSSPATSATANGVSGAAGAYPSTSGSGANYWVDVVLVTSAPAGAAPDTTAPVLTGYGPTGTGVSATSDVTFQVSEQLASTGTATLTSPSGSTVSAAYSFDAATLTGRLNPWFFLSGRTTYTVTVSGQRDAAGNTLAPVTWTFTTA
ncbi:DUF4082 domain-containing protein [Goekera deserti]|uniref:DUF4082 domain-containing protein n=1 Tax=Goekera deserti TaxID=2497753 RepID=UPI003899504E